MDTLALFEIRQQNPDILLSDLKMPGMSGREIANQSQAPIPGYKGDRHKRVSFRGNDVPAGVIADAFYPKGSSVSALLRILRELPLINQRSPGSPSD